MQKGFIQVKPGGTPKRPYNITDPNITLNWDNLEALCRTCHQNEHFITGCVTAKGVGFDEDGNLIKL